MDRSLKIEYQLPKLSPQAKNQPYKPSFSRRHQRSQQRMRMVLNSVSLSKSTDKPESQAIILPSTKFNKLVKLIQFQRDEIKPLKPHKPVINLNDQWKYNEDQNTPKPYERRGKGKRVKTEMQDQEQKWTIIRKRVQTGQLSIKFPQLGLVNKSLMVASESPTEKQMTKATFKSKSYIIKTGKLKNEGIKQALVELHKTQPMEANIDISGWTMNEF